MMTRAHRNVLRIMLVGAAGGVGILLAIWWYGDTIDKPMRACESRQGGVWNARTHVCRIAPDVSCEQHGGWWEPMSKTCAKVVSVPSITGRPVAPAH